MLTVSIIIAVLIGVNIVLSRINADAIITAIYITSGQEHKSPLKPILNQNKPIKETPEQIRERTILENLEAYDGTGKGQSKI